MKSKLKELTIGFENLETVHIPGENVASFYVDGITAYLYNDYYSDEITEGYNAKELTLILRPQANENLKDGWNGKTVFERLSKYNDITDVDFVFQNKTKHYSVFWDDPDLENVENKSQTSAFGNNGHMIISISAKTKADEIAKTFKGAF